MIPLKIETMYAWVCIDDDGSEGIPATFINGAWFPLIGADLERIESMRKYAMELGKPIRLVQFTNMVVLETVNQPD